MATTLAMAREAEHILSAAAVRAGLPETVPAAELLDAFRGVPVPVRAERALRQAVHTARTPDLAPTSSTGPYLLPLREDAESRPLLRDSPGTDRRTRRPRSAPRLRGLSVHPVHPHGPTLRPRGTARGRPVHRELTPMVLTAPKPGPVGRVPRTHNGQTVDHERRETRPAPEAASR